ncbi:SRPBCC domain-containing protein [Paraflavisolibacter sp. H34]|uniref:SRPBCC family protein n=1 Tax=Huijunlia imazamoxiresistens TaxID=3127457 RepID=UPI003016EDCA
MKKLQFSIDVNAPREKVWKVLWDDATYRSWTSVFSEGSHAVSDWKEGSKIYFLSANGDGMNSVIAKNIPNEFMSFQHLGMLKDGKEVPPDAETEKWAGALENYTLKGHNGATTLTVDMDATEEFEAYFQEKLPQALDKVKQLAEG